MCECCQDCTTSCCAFIIIDNMWTMIVWPSTGFFIGFMAMVVASITNVHLVTLCFAFIMMIVSAILIYFGRREYLILRAKRHKDLKSV